MISSQFVSLGLGFVFFLNWGQFVVQFGFCMISVEVFDSLVCRLPGKLYLRSDQSVTLCDKSCFVSFISA